MEMLRTYGADSQRGISTMLSSHQWEQVRDSLLRGKKVMEGLSIVAGAKAAREADLRKAATYQAASTAAQGTAFLAEQAAEFCDQQATETRKAEDAARIEAEKRTREAAARVAAEKLRADQRDRRFQNGLRDAIGTYERSVHDGSFLKNYRDFPTERAMDIASRSA